MLSSQGVDEPKIHPAVTAEFCFVSCRIVIWLRCYSVRYSGYAYGIHRRRNDPPMDSQ